MKTIKVILIFLLSLGSIGSILAIWDIIHQLEPNYVLEWSVIGSTILFLLIYVLVVYKPTSEVN